MTPALVRRSGGAGTAAAISLGWCAYGMFAPNSTLFGRVIGRGPREGKTLFASVRATAPSPERRDRIHRVLEAVPKRPRRFFGPRPPRASASPDGFPAGAKVRTWSKRTRSVIPAPPQGNSLHRRGASRRAVRFTDVLDGRRDASGRAWARNRRDRRGSLATTSSDGRSCGIQLPQRSRRPPPARPGAIIFPPAGASDHAAKEGAVRCEHAVRAPSEGNRGRGPRAPDRRDERGGHRTALR